MDQFLLHLAVLPCAFLFCAHLEACRVALPRQRLQLTLQCSRFAVAMGIPSPLLCGVDHRVCIIMPTEALVGAGAL